MHQNIDKQLIHQRFLRSMNSYDKNALVQKQMTSNLVNNLLQISDTINFSRVLEIGCGTGCLTKSLLENINIETYYLNDIVFECSEFINSLSKDYPQTSFHFIHRDAEELENAPELLNLVISNAVFQWLNNLKQFIKHLYKLITYNGILAFSTFGKNNLHEINVIENKSLYYFSKNEIISYVEKYFSILYFNEENLELQFDTPKDVLKHLKYTGTKGLQKEVWTKKHLLEFENSYNTLFRKNNKVSLTYNPIYIIAKRR